MPPPPNFRDVGITLHLLNPASESDDVSEFNFDSAFPSRPLRKGTNCCSLLQPGLLLRSGAFDSAPCGWRDIGSPRTIVNLREFSADETYSRLAGEAASSHTAAVKAEAKADGVGDPHCSENKSENFIKLEVWNCSAANDQEKYDVRNCEVRDWILGVITRLLESPGSTDHVEGRLSATAAACSSESQGLASAVAAFLAEYLAAVEGLEKSLSDEGLALLHAISPFRLALSFLLREALCVCGPMLVHCRFGRDRTGIMVAAVLTAICPTVTGSAAEERLRWLINEDFKLSVEPAKNDARELFETKTLPFLEASVFGFLEGRRKRILSDATNKRLDQLIAIIARQLRSNSNHPGGSAQVAVGLQDIAFRYCAEEVERRFAVCRKIDVSVAEELDCLKLWLLYGYASSAAALKEASGRSTEDPQSGPFSEDSVSEEMQLLQLRVSALFAAKRLREVKQRLSNAENLASLLPVQMSPLAHLVSARLPGHWGREESGSKQFKEVEARLESFIREVGEKRASSGDKPHPHLKAVGMLKWIRKVLGT